MTASTVYETEISVVDVAVFVSGVVITAVAFVAIFCYVFVPPRSWFLNYWFFILGIKDPEEKEKAMMKLFESLPTPNRHTSIYLLDHLRRYVTWSVALVTSSEHQGGVRRGNSLPPGDEGGL